MSIDDLIQIMEKLNAVYNEMLDIADLKRQAIIDNQVEDLVQIMNRESKGMKWIEQLETQRQEFVSAYLRDRGVKSQLELTMTELSRLVFDQTDKSRLLDIQSRLSETLHKLKLKNELNQQLIMQSLEFIDLSLDLLTGKPAQEATYHPPSKRNVPSGSPGIFDTRA